MVKTFFDIPDNALNITHGKVSNPHRVVFRNSKPSGTIPITSGVFWKLDKVIRTNETNAPIRYFKNNSYTIGLSRKGKVVIYVKSDLNVFPKEFLRSLREDFLFENFEIKFLIERLNFVELEISHKINDPLAKLKNAHIDYGLDGLINKLIAFTDNSHGKLELELKGDPETSGNLEFLLRDKLNAVLYFAELTKIIVKQHKTIESLKSSMEYIKRNNDFMLNLFLDVFIE